MAQSGTPAIQEAARAQGQGDFNKAIALYTEALRDNALPNDRRAIVLSDRGALYARINQAKLAIDDFNRAVQLYPEYPAIYNNRGSTLMTLGFTREAVKDFDRAILLAPGYAAAYNNRAGANVMLKQHQNAIRDYTKALELTPNAIAPLNGRGKALLAADRPQAAMRDFTRAIKTDARFTLGYRSRAEARIAADRFGDAVEDLSRAIAFEPNDAHIYVDRGRAYMASGDTHGRTQGFRPCARDRRPPRAGAGGARVRASENRGLRRGRGRYRARHRARSARHWRHLPRVRYSICAPARRTSRAGKSSGWPSSMPSGRKCCGRRASSRRLTASERRRSRAIAGRWRRCQGCVRPATGWSGLEIPRGEAMPSSCAGSASRAGVWCGAGSGCRRSATTIRVWRFRSRWLARVCRG